MAGRKGYLPEKTWMIANFNSAARGYDGIAELQKTVARRLLEHLDPIRINPFHILDLGSGTGGSARELKKRFGRALVVQLDIAAQMLGYSRTQSARFFSGQRFVCADAEALPFQPASFDLVYSNLMIQWCHEINGLFAGLARCLKPGGLLLFSTLGPDTLKELRQSWAETDDAIHVNNFIDMHHIGDALIRAGFADPVMETEQIVMTYPDITGLLRELKRLGARNINAGRRRSLTGRARFQGMLRAYEKRRVGGKVPASYEIIYGHAWAQDQPVRTVEQVSVIPVSSIREKDGS